jgi:hypothetical protein
MLLPLENRGLREVKQRIVDLQNVALESLRVDEAWEPDGAAILEAIGPVVEPVASEAAAAGAEAAGLMAGGPAPPPVFGVRSAELVRRMARDLSGQLEAALARVAGAGPREVSATVSRVFRAWRTDEAERWLRSVARASYHDSLIAGLAASGVGSVVGVAHGAPCAECPAGSGETWDPAGDLPAGTVLPPAHLDCACTVAPTR